MTTVLGLGGEDPLTDLSLGSRLIQRETAEAEAPETAEVVASGSLFSAAERDSDKAPFEGFFIELPTRIKCDYLFISLQPLGH